MWCKCKKLRAAVPVVHRVGVVRERLRGRYVGVGPVWLGRRGCRGWGMMEGGHRGATRGRHWAGGLHSCRLLLLIGTVANRRAVRQEPNMLLVVPVNKAFIHMIAHQILLLICFRCVCPCQRTRDTAVNPDHMLSRLPRSCLNLEDTTDEKKKMLGKLRKKYRGIKKHLILLFYFILLYFPIV